MAQQGSPPGRSARHSRPESYDPYGAVPGADGTGEAGWSDEPRRSGEHSRPDEPRWSGEQSGTDAAGWTQEPRRSGEHSRPDEPGWSQEPRRSGEHSRPDEPGWSQEPRWSGEHSRPDEPRWSGEQARPDVAGWTQEPSWSGQPGRADQPPQPTGAGWADQPRWDGEPGAGVQQDWAARPEQVAEPVGPGRRGRPDHQPRRAERAPRPARADWLQSDAFAPEADQDVPSWAGPGIYPARPARTAHRAAPSAAEDDAVVADDYAQRGNAADEGVPARLGRRRGRAAAARLRKSRRRVYRWCGTAIAACLVAAAIVLVVTNHPPKKLPYVTSLQKGEFKSVPDACTSVGASVLNAYLPGPSRTVTAEQSGATDSQCSITVDHKPTFLVLEVTSVAYRPFPAASGDGSASDNAQDNYAGAQQVLAHPGKKSPLPPAQISHIASLGQQAFLAIQQEHVSGIVTDVVTVVVRERNDLITVSLSGQESGHGFGPVPATTLQAGATAAARAVLAKALTQPTA